MNMRYLTKRNFQIYLETSVTYFNTEDFNWSVHNYALATFCVGYNSLHKDQYWKLKHLGNFQLTPTKQLEPL